MHVQMFQPGTGLTRDEAGVGGGRVVAGARHSSVRRELERLRLRGRSCRKDHGRELQTEKMGTFRKKIELLIFCDNISVTVCVFLFFSS